MTATQFDLTDDPSPDELAAIGQGLNAYNVADVGPSDRRLIAVLLRDDAGQPIGGLSGYTSWGWLFTQQLFIPKPLRGQGMVGRLLTAAEAQAQARGCKGAWIDTFNPVALRAYQRQGYVIFGEIPDYVADRSRTFLQKRLDTAQG
jgi:GNAT superfamily N-acetyltransferase